MSTVEKATCKPSVFPYFAERESWPPDTLNLIYRKLVAEDILPDLVHEKGISEEDFVRFVDEDTLPYLFVDLTTNQIAGIAWYDAVEEGDCLRKARGSFAFFKEYWHPTVTEAFGLMFLSHGFNVLGYDVIYGITPASNKLAKRYCERIGMVYQSTIPNFTSRRGELTDSMICTMTREQFNARLSSQEDSSGEGRS